MNITVEIRKEDLKRIMLDHALACVEGSTPRNETDPPRSVDLVYMEGSHRGRRESNPVVAKVRLNKRG